MHREAPRLSPEYYLLCLLFILLGVSRRTFLVDSEFADLKVPLLWLIGCYDRDNQVQADCTPGIAGRV